MKSQEPAYELLTDQHDEDDDDGRSSTEIVPLRNHGLFMLLRRSTVSPIYCASGLFLLLFLLVSIAVNV